MQKKKLNHLSKSTQKVKRGKVKITRNLKNEPGIFITFEGVEGSGKSIQTKLLFEYLKGTGYIVNLTREPGGTDTGERIRKILLESSEDILPYTEFFLYLADRAQHIEKIIKPRLKNGEIVISDRFFDSTIAYQQFGRNISENEINIIRNLRIFSSVEPDITFLLDIDPKTVKGRVYNPDRIERENIEFHRIVRNAYLELANNNSERILIIDAQNTIDDIHLIIRKKITDLIQEVKYA